MHAPALSSDLNWFVQFLFTSFLVLLGLLHLVKNTASKYFIVDDDANFEKGVDYLARSSESDRTDMPGVSFSGDACFVCGEPGSKKCSGCKAVRYCSGKCQREHWLSGHKKTCKDTHKASGFEVSNATRIALVPVGGTSKTFKQSKKILFPYDEFVRIFNWDKQGFSPCGLLNCGNSCFANVVLQCLTYTRPLVAYLLEKGHRRECRLNDWCFLCEFETHLLRASRSGNPFSPINILSRLPNIGGNLGYGKQEDAHEFMRFAIDTMQSVCLAEYGGEKAVNPSSQETTLIQHIFGGHLQSQVICTNCNKISNQYENMMDLTVEIHGDAASLEECLDQFTVKEWLHGDNMYKCDGCNDYVKAWKRLTVRQAPNILTIALKRFQSGRFGKLNKRVTFPETLDLSPYMTEAVNGTDVYKLYAVVVHVDMLNASYFGHYICYIKDFRGYWYMIDDCKVVDVELEEVLSQGAYMLLYKRVNARPSHLEPIDASKNEEQQMVDVTPEVAPLIEAQVIPVEVSHFEKDSSFVSHCETLKEDTDVAGMMNPMPSILSANEVEVYGNGQPSPNENTSPGDEHKNSLLSGSFLSSNKKLDIGDEDGVNKLLSRIISSNEGPFNEDEDSLDNASPLSLNDISISPGVGLQKPGLQKPSCTEDAATLKPHFTPVFHRKRPRSKRNNNDVFQRGFLNQKPKNYQEKSYLNGNSLSFVPSVPEQLANSLNDIEMVDVKIDDSINICKGEIISDIADGNDGDIIMNDAEEKNNGFHSGTSGTASHSQ